MFYPIRLQKLFFFISLLSSTLLFAYQEKQPATPNKSFSKDLNQSTSPLIQTQEAEERLTLAISNPEYMLNNWVVLPMAPGAKSGQIRHLSLREAILLALRYNPNIQNAELDRIIQRYQLRLAQNEFELQYALVGSASAQRVNYAGQGSTSVDDVKGIPEVNLKTATGARLALNLANNVSQYNTYSPVLNLSLTQPLLRGFGKEINQAALLNANDTEWLNKLQLKQSIIDQITQVILSYRSLILSANSLETQKFQLAEAKKTLEVNKQKIDAGQLEPTANIQQSYQVESLSLMLEEAENDFKTATQSLLEAIGLDPKMKLAVPNNVSLDAIKIPNRKEAVQLALAHNTQYLSQQRLICADERAYKVALDEQRWQLDVSANLQSGKTSDLEGRNIDRIRNIFSGESVNLNAKLDLRIPIQNLNDRSKVIQAKVKLEQDKLRLLTMKRALETTVMTIINNMESLLKRYELNKKQVQLASQSYELEKKKLTAGISTSLDLNNTQNQLIQAQKGLISAKIAYLNQLSALQQVLGTTLVEWQIKVRYCG